jgi:hypothetical protein
MAKSIAELFDDGRLMEAAAKRAVRQAVRGHQPLETRLNARQVRRIALRYLESVTEMDEEIRRAARGRAATEFADW